jgi:transposase
MSAYPQEFRDRVLAALGRGESANRIARRLEVSRYFVYQVRDRFVLEGERGIRQLGGYRRSVIEGMESTLRAWLKAEPDLTLQEICDRLATHGRLLKVAALWHQLNKWGLSLKKNPARQRARAARRKASPRAMEG